MRAILTKLGIMAVSIVIGLALLECGLRILGRYPPIAPHVMPAGAVFRDKETDWDITYRTNSLGLRDIEHAYPRTATKRIVIIGASAAFGQGVERELAYPALLQELLIKRSDSTEVINVSAIGAGPENYYMLLREIGLRFHPDIVVVNVFGRDAAESPSLMKRTLRALSHNLRLFSLVRIVNKRLSDRRSAEFAANPDRFWEFLRDRCASFHSAGDCRDIVGHFRASHGSSMNMLAAAVLSDPEGVRQWVDTDSTSEGWSYFVANITAITRLCKEHGAKMVLAFMPEGAQVDPRQVALESSLGLQRSPSVLLEPGTFQVLVTHLANTLGVGVYNPLGLFRSRIHGLFFEADLHIDPAGHRLFAEGLATYLLEQGYLTSR
jgi:lysophospholipase L1-like esterase